MKKKGLIVLLVLVMAVSLVACGAQQDNGSSASTDQVYNLRMSTLHTKATPGYEYCEWFVNRVAELTDNHVQIELYPGSQLGDYTQTFGELITGSLDLSWESIPTEYDPELQLVSAPYLVSTWDEVKYAYNPDSWFGQFFGKIFDRLGMEQLAVAPGGFYGIGGKKVAEDLDKIFDLDVPKKVLCRVPAMTGSILTVEALNYTPTTINYSDLYSALQTGVADCWYGGSVDLNYENFRDVISYYVAFNYLNEYYPLLISKKTMEKLPAEYQEAIRQAGREANEVAFDTIYKSYYDYFDKLKEYGITVIEPTEEQLEEMGERVRDAVWDQLGDAEDIQGLRDFVAQMKADLAKKEE